LKQRGQAALVFTALVGLSGLSLFPVFWMPLTAIRLQSESFARTLYFWPSTIDWQNFSRIWSTYSVGY
jgi:ABC-type glycerol-3-phosphate transport system permease component